MRVPEPRTSLFLFICLTLVYGAHVIHEYKPYTWAHADPGWMVSTVMSIVEDHDLDLRNQLHNDPNQAADQTSLGKNGEWYPLHELLMPVLTVPFYILLGIDGCLVFNVLVSILFMIVIFQLCSRHVSTESAFAGTVLIAFPTLFLDYTYSYSLDVFSAFLLILAYWCAVSRRFVLTGFVWSLAIYARLPNVVTLAGLLPFLLLPLQEDDPQAARSRNSGRVLGRVRPCLLSLAGAVPVALCFVTSNWLMFGSAFTTSYDRWQHFVGGNQAVVTSQRGAFSCSLLDRLPGVLADPKSGLLIGAPLILVALAFGARSFWQKARSEMIMLSLVSLALLILFGKYCNSYPGTLGNRYLMPIAALSALPLSMAIQTCFEVSGMERLKRGEQ